MGDSNQELAEKLGQEIETQYADEDIALLVKQKGFREISP